MIDAHGFAKKEEVLIHIYNALIGQLRFDDMLSLFITSFCGRLLKTFKQSLYMNSQIQRFIMIKSVNVLDL
jgi:hypothetical protein